MIGKKEAIEIVKAMIENAINCNDEYECTIKHIKGGIVVEDKFGKALWQYEIPMSLDDEEE